MKELIARENIALGDVVTRLWKIYARRSIAKDSKIEGFCDRDVKNGEKFNVLKNINW